MQKGRVHLIIHGYVQGVFFRASTRDKAVSLGMKDGSEIFMTGVLRLFLRVT